MANKFKPTKLVKIKRGWRGSGDEYQYGEVILVTGRSGYGHRTNVYEKGKMGEGQHIWQSDQHEDFRPAMKRFRLFLEQKERELLKKMQSQNDK